MEESLGRPLTPEQTRLWGFMRKDRAHEVHRSGSSRKAVTEKREVGAGTYRLKSATVTIAVPPDVRSGIHMQMPTYSFTIAGTERKATEACGEYLALLKRRPLRSRFEGWPNCEGLE